jgi:pimeloyl-ACP methyl ester carboxylesterase
MTVSPRIPRTHRVLLCGALLAATWLALASQPADAAAPKPAWTTCYVRMGPFECTTVRVPLDYAHPDGETIAIALTRLPATDQEHRIGSLFLNPGGPGGSGVDLVVALGPQLYTPEVRARFDLVGFDPRGIMRSSGLRCFGTQKQWGLALPPSTFPLTPEEEAQTEDADRTLNHACEARGTRLRDHMSTGNVARDLDVLRDAVGDDKLTYAGFSYGSYLGTTYANLFPDRVRAVVVDGVVDPIAWSTGRDDEALTLPFSTRLHSHDGAQATLDEFFRLCDAAGDRCAFSGGSAARFATLAERARQAPLKIVFPDGFTTELRYSDLIGMTLSAMYSSTVWKPFARMLADIERYSSPAAVGTSVQAFLATYGSSLYPNFLEGSPAVACEDSDNPHGYAAWSSAGAQADASSYFGRAWTWAWSPCAEWKGFDPGRYMGPFDKPTANPVLAVGSRFDPATRYEGAVTVHDLMPNSALLTVNGWGHTSLFMSACADAAVARYLIEIVTPPAGTTCSQDLDPFASDTPGAPAAAKRLRALSYVNGESPRSRRLAPRGTAPGGRMRPRTPGVAWSDLTGSAIDALGAQTAVNDRGAAVYAWSSSDPSTGLAEVRARTRSAGGSLGRIVAISDPAADVFDVRVAMNARGAAAFTWLEYDAASDVLVLKSRSRSARGALGTIASMSETGTNAFDHRVAISGDGSAIVTWTTADLQAGRLHAKARVRPAAGTPGPVLDLADPALDSFTPQVAIDRAGIATFAWTQSDAATGRLSVRTRSLAPGGALGPASDVSAGTRDTAAANVAVDRAGDAVFEWLAFDPASFHAVVQARSRSRKGDLGPVVDLSDAADDAWDQALAVDGDGDAVFTWWVPTRSGARVEASSLSASGAVGPRRTLSDPADDGYEPQVAIDADGDAAFTWLAFDRDGVRVQARPRSRRGAFGATADLTRPSEDAFSAQVAVTARGDAVFGWSALNGAGYQVQGRSRPAGGGFGPLTVISTIDRDAFEAQVNRTSTRLDGIAGAR